MCQNNCSDYSLRTASTGIAKIAIANSNLNGSGAVTTVFTAGQNGAIIKSVIIQATEPVLQGMVRLYIRDSGGNVTSLYQEVEVPTTPFLAATPTPVPVLQMFQVICAGNFKLNAGYHLLASTQYANKFNIITEALDWEYPNPIPGTCCNFRQEVATTGIGIVTVANTNLDGTGAIVPIFTAPAQINTQPSNGSTTFDVTIKALESTRSGAVRLFISPDGITYSLLKEVMIPEHIQAPGEPSYLAIVTQEFNLQPGYVIGASTDNGDSFAVTIEGVSWNYPI